jgi:hypothetical protein
MKFKEVAHLYLRCKCKVECNGEESYDETMHGIKYMTPLVGGRKFDVAGNYHFTPILRPLSNITYDEFNKMKDKMLGETVMAIQSHGLKRVILNRIQTNSLSFKDGLVLLENNFDLFGLIQSGEAIDATTLFPNPYRP